MLKATVILLFITLPTIGCAASNVRPLTGPSANPPSLDFLVDGATDRHDVVSRIGEAPQEFESSRLAVYRLDKRMQVTRDWASARFNLVLVFDQRGVLQRHGIVRLK